MLLLLSSYDSLQIALPLEQGRQNEIVLAYLYYFKGLDHVIGQDIHETLPCVDLCQWDTYELQFTFRLCKHSPLPRSSLTLSHALLVVVGSARGSNEASTVFALRRSFRKESILQGNRSR